MGSRFKSTGHCTPGLSDPNGKGRSYAPKSGISPPRLRYQAEDTQSFEKPLKTWQKPLPTSCSLARPTHFHVGAALERNHCGERFPLLSVPTELCFTPAPSDRGEPIGNEILDLESTSGGDLKDPLPRASSAAGLASTAPSHLTSWDLMAKDLPSGLT